jgi:hypothetical protein
VTLVEADDRLGLGRSGPVGVPAGTNRTNRDTGRATYKWGARHGQADPRRGRDECRAVRASWSWKWLTSVKSHKFSDIPPDERQRLTNDREGLTKERHDVTNERPALKSKENGRRKERHVITNDRQALTTERQLLNDERQARTTERPRFTKDRRGITKECHAVTT